MDSFEKFHQMELPTLQMMNMTMLIKFGIPL